MKSFAIALRPAHFGLLGILLTTSAALAATVSTCTEAALRAALSADGVATFSCVGTVVLAGPIVVDRSITVDAAGNAVTLSGAGLVRLFEVKEGGVLRFVGLTLADGAAIGTNGDPNIAGAGGDASGGAIQIRGGTLQASGCRFERNSATGSLNNAAARLAPLSAYGGPTPTFAFLDGSAALDAADSSSCPATDQRGRTYRLQESTDLSSWSAISTNVMPASQLLRFDRLRSGDASQRFYRAVGNP